MSSLHQRLPYTLIQYVRVDLEQTLSGSAIVGNILKKGNSRLKFLYRQEKYHNTRCRKLLTSTLILCHFDYACSAWYSGLKKTPNLTKKQYGLLLITPPPPLLWTHLDIAHFTKMQWPQVDVRVELLNVSIMHRNVHIWGPCYLTEVRHMILRRDIERCLSPCHPNGKWIEGF